MRPARRRARSGLGPIDEHFGGVYCGSPVLCRGTPRSGKTLAALQFAAQGLADGERTLLISDAPRPHLAALAALLNIELDAAERDGMLLLLHSDQVDAGPSEANFEAVQLLLDTHRIRRLVLDPVQRWFLDPDHPDPRADVISFVDCLDAAQVTALLTLSWTEEMRESAHAKHLHDLVPVCISMRRATDDVSALAIQRYLGETPPAGEFRLSIQQGRGLVEVRT